MEQKLNKLLLDFLPELSDVYQKEVSWQEGDGTGSHVVYEDVYVPYLLELLEHDKDASRAVELLDKVLEIGGQYGEEVVAYSVFESVVDRITDKSKLEVYLSGKALELFEEVVS